MNWSKISVLITAITLLTGSVWWFSANVVLSAEFNAYQNQQEVRWLKQDKSSAWREYIDLRQLGNNKTKRDDIRILELENEIKDIETEIKALR
ncbi:MAG: hypothetical protein JKY80_02015 [Mariprofundaceae bacterium]|nr:hypothetical protein [Methylophaga sp.]MBL4759616.1 hypothetical protein [Mariprofundaceae bacterium]